MKIKELFERPIDRDLKGVIKVGQEDESSTAQELDEYVVTQELSRHFATFFKNYEVGINGNTDKMGVWISGFFGSGKSHFLKILSYLLENRVAHGKSALSYFEDGKKIQNEKTLSEIKEAASVPTDVILFNIDAKSDSTGRNEEKSMVKTFLRVFNEMQGFCGSLPYVADLERFLTKEGKYDAFKEKFEEINGGLWEKERDDIIFIADDVRDAIVDVGLMNQERADNWISKVDDSYDISIDDFGKLLKDYLDRKNKEEGTDNHHLVFLVDEVGQYIGGNTHVMLNLQTICETLGTVGKGKIWIIVTSQQNIDEVVRNLEKEDFSKIQGRFDTRLSLSSANVDEVIRKRILKKNEVASEALKQFYREKEISIKNKISFNDSVEKKVYTGADNFAAVYPFVTYQFNLLAHVLTEIRTHSASGKHLSEGERSMLGMFKEAAMAVKEKDTGVLVPFSAFYDPMESFLDHTHRSVIIRALGTDAINPGRESQVFAVELLKLLFLIKYVQDVKANEDNLTSLMISDINEDRSVLKEQIHKALQILVNQNLVQRNGDIYIFLTNEEQEVNQAIENIRVENSNIRQKIGEIIFDTILGKTAYTVPGTKGRYTYRYNSFIDDYSFRGGQEPVGMRIITSLSDTASDDSSLRTFSMQNENDLIVVLPETDRSVEDISRALRIDAFFRQNNKNSIGHYEEVRNARTNERSERLERAGRILEESLKEARIYFRGNPVEVYNGDAATRLTEAFGCLIGQIYNKRPLMDTLVDEKDIENVLRGNSEEALGFDKNTQPNEAAIEETSQYLARHSREKISLRTLKNQFTAIPYGFIGTDVSWIAARLFMDGEIALTLAGAPVTIQNTAVPVLSSYFTRRQQEDNLIIEKRTRVSESDLKRVWSVLKTLWPNAENGKGDEDHFFDLFHKLIHARIEEMEKWLNVEYTLQRYPGKPEVEKGIRLLKRLESIGRPKELVDAIRKNEDELRDYAEDYGPIQYFFTGGQMAIFDKALKAEKRYDASKFYILDETIKSLAAKIHSILVNPRPYEKIKELPNLTTKLDERYVDFMEREAGPVKERIQREWVLLNEELKDKSYGPANVQSWFAEFKQLMDEADQQNNIKDLKGLKEQASTLRERYEDKMVELDEIEEKKKAQKNPETIGVTVTVSPMRRKTVVLQSIMNGSREIRSQDDIQRILNELRLTLEKELGRDGNTTVKVIF